MPGARRNKLAMLTVGGAKLADLSLDFTVPGYSSIELKVSRESPYLEVRLIMFQLGGAHIDVDDHNLEEYLEKVLDFILGSGVQRQAQAFAEGMLWPVHARDAVLTGRRLLHDLPDQRYEDLLARRTWSALRQHR